MLNFLKRKVDVANHWIAFVEQFNMSSLGFYENVQKEIEASKVPGLEVDRIEFSEGSLLSQKRTYLRFVRERLVFDVCACPVGTGFFFSCRAAVIPAVIRPIELLVLIIGANLALGLSARFFGLFLGPFILLLLVIGTGYVLRNAIALGLEDLDRILIRTPVIGPFYEVFLRKETYYREDTRLMYLDLIPRIVKRHAEDVTASKGVRFCREYIRAPVLGELYKQVEQGTASDYPGFNRQQSRTETAGL